MDFKKLCKLLSAYFDEELESNICAEIDELVNEDFGCKVLFNTFNKTIELCKELQEEIEVPEEVHIRLYEFLKIEMRKK
jgi:hypothetical protein